MRVPRPSARSIPALGAVVLAAIAIGCGAKTPEDVGLRPLAPCPRTPNCVSSVASPSSAAYVEPMAVIGDAEAAWATALGVLGDWPRLQMRAASDAAVHAEVTSRIFRFVDDLELRLRRAEGRIDVRSASRVGRSDLGANRRRVERLRELLIERGVVSADGGTWRVEP